jgi:hypothetical protein
MPMEAILITFSTGFISARPLTLGCHERKRKKEGGVAVNRLTGWMAAEVGDAGQGRAKGSTAEVRAGRGKGCARCRKGRRNQWPKRASGGEIPLYMLLLCVMRTFYRLKFNSSLDKKYCRHL